VGTIEVVLADAALARGTKLGVLDVLQQIFFFEGAFVGFGEGLFGAEDHVEDETGERHQYYKSHTQGDGEDVAGASRDVAVAPYYAGEIEGEQVGSGARQKNLQ